jgi:hypothetical protein
MGAPDVGKQVAVFRWQVPPGFPDMLSERLGANPLMGLCVTDIINISWGSVEELSFVT